MNLSKLRLGLVGVACAMVVGMASPALGQCVLAPSGLVAWWDGDDVSATTAFDIQGTNDGTLLNGVVTSLGQVGTAFSFNGVNQFIDVGNPPSLDPAGQSELTVDAWVFPATAQNNFATIIDKRDQTVGNGGTQWIMQFQLAGDKRRPEFAVATDTAAAFAQASQDLTADVWHHLAGVYDGTTVRLFVDGALAASQLMGAGGGAIKTFPAPSPTVSIGAFEVKFGPGAGFKSFFTGLIDEVEIYNRALSDSEILAIFNAGSAGKCKIEPEIDIKPGSFPNSINLGSQGLVPVAILSSPDFDANDVDADTVELAGAGVAVRGRGRNQMSHLEDVNGDGLLDLVIQVETQNFDPGQFQDGFATLTGLTFGGSSIGGIDEIVIVPQ